MIIVNLKGGLGNQMFQYACGRALSLRTQDQEFKIDVNGLERAIKVGDVYRPYSLSNFNIIENIANIHEIKKIKYPYGIFSKCWHFFRKKFLRQNYVSFVPKIIKLRGNIYLDGYFQTEKYFKDFGSTIKNDFTPKNISRLSNTIIEKISQEQNSVSIHIRRGDYVGHKILGGMCNDRYYIKAFEEINKSVTNPHFYIFSNEIDWVKENMTFPYPTTYVSSPEIPDYEELILMSHCKHNIIANSSFSWWGAWLNSNPNKIVIAPKKWANGVYNQIKLRDIIPNTWHKI